MNLDTSFVRSHFPAFREPSLAGWAFFENAGGSYPCQQVIDRLTTFYSEHKVQPYQGYPASRKAGRLMDMAYRRMADYLHTSPEEIHFGPSTTQNVYILARALKPLWKEGDEIIVSNQDHEANSGAWRRLQEEGLNIIEWKVKQDSGKLDVADLKKILSKKTKIIAFPHCSNVIGHLNPTKEIVKLAHENGAITVIDGVGYAPHGFPDLKDLETDIYLFSTYKTFGPHLGVMFIRNHLMGKMANQSHFFKEGATRYMFTPAGPDHAQIAAVNGILDYFDALHEHHIGTDVPSFQKGLNLKSLFRRYETQLLYPVLQFLRDHEGVQIIGPTEAQDRLPIVSILPTRKNVQDVYQNLISNKIMAGMGHFYAVRPLQQLGVSIDPGVLRLSWVHYTTEVEINQLIKALAQALE